MKNLRVYLDTSVLSHLFADDTPEKMEHTKIIWEEFKSGKYEILISTTTLLEIEKCPEPKRNKIKSKLDEIEFQLLTANDEVRNLAKAYLKNGVLTPHSHDDCMHIAFAVVANCDIIFSWNFKHLVNFKTVNKVKIVNALNGYREISIMPPTSEEV